MTNPIVQNCYLYNQKFLLAKESVLVLSVLDSMYRLGLVDMLVTHTNMNVFGLTSLSGALHGYMPPQLKTKNVN